MNNRSEIARRRALAAIVARGLADLFSDIEIDIFWHAPPTDADRSAPEFDTSAARAAFDERRVVGDVDAL